MATNKTSITERVRAYQKMHPNATTAQVAKACKTTVKYVYGIRYSDKRGGANVKTPKQQWKMVHMSTSKESALPFKEEAERIYELTKGRQRMHPVTGKLLMQGSERFNKESVIQEDTPADNVNHPAHYKVGGVEVIDFIEAKKLNYHLGNVVKYIARADEKGNREEDLLKARWYLNREIAKFTK